jgi:hypothetical protein
MNNEPRPLKNFHVKIDGTLPAADIDDVFRRLGAHYTGLAEDGLDSEVDDPFVGPTNITIEPR